MTCFRARLFALVVLALPAGAAVAQERGPLAVGETVRVEMDVETELGRARPTAQGTVVALTRDSLWLETRRSPSPAGYAFAELRRILVPVPRGAGAGAARGALLGALFTGGTLGVLGMIALDGGDENVSDGSWFLLGGGLGALVGAPIGAIVGAQRPGKRWLPAPPPAAPR